jgi:hypothetical protein
MIGKIHRAAPGLAALVLAAGCASTQQVSLECVPSEVRVYVDGRELEGRRSELSLAVAEPHTLYFKGGSYRPQMVVLESREVDGERVLSNADLCQRLVFTEVSPEVRMRLDPDDLPPE